VDGVWEVHVLAVDCGQTDGVSWLPLLDGVSAVYILLTS
jgi:hypothetical protein